MLDEVDILVVKLIFDKCRKNYRRVTSLCYLYAIYILIATIEIFDKYRKSISQKYDIIKN